MYVSSSIENAVLNKAPCSGYVPVSETVKSIKKISNNFHLSLILGLIDST